MSLIMTIVALMIERRMTVTVLAVVAVVVEMADLRMGFVLAVVVVRLRVAVVVEMTDLRMGLVLAVVVVMPRVVVRVEVTVL